jgi:uncharacterized membrane protein
MKQRAISLTIIDTISALFILLFVYTAISKLQDHTRFVRILSQSPLLSSAAGFISISLPLVELAITILLFFPVYRELGMILTLALMLAFTLYISFMLLYTSDLPCACGGVLKNLSWSEHLKLNIGLTLLIAFGLWLHRKNKFFVAINRNSRIPV